MRKPSLHIFFRNSVISDLYLFKTKRTVSLETNPSAQAIFRINKRLWSILRIDSPNKCINFSFMASSITDFILMESSTLSGWHFVSMIGERQFDSFHPFKILSTPLPAFSALPSIMNIVCNALFLHTLSPPL